MFYEKRMPSMGVGLAIVSMLLFIWAMTSVLHARPDSSAFDVSGATTFTLGTCKADPCTDTLTMHVDECYDYGGTSCRDDLCVTNVLRYLECGPCEDAPPGANDCMYSVDNSDWRRWIIVRYMSCNSNTPDSGLYGECRISGTYPGWSTPCVIDLCYGELFDDYIHSVNRARCE